MPNSDSRPWKMLLPLAAVLLLALLWTIYWFIASATAKARFEHERERFVEQGFSLTCAEEAWGGYPFHFEFACRSPIIKLENRVKVSSSDLLLVALAYAPWQLVALIDGPSEVIAERGPTTASAEHQRVIAAVTFDRDWKPKLSTEVPALSVAGIGRAQLVMLHARPSALNGFDIAVTARDIHYQPPGSLPLSISAGEFLGTLSPDRSLRIDRLTLEQNAVRYWGTGTVGLDSSNRLSGKLDTETNDLDGLLAIIEPHLLLSDEEKAGLRSILGLLGSGAKVPLIARGGLLYLGPFKIAELRPLY